MNYHANILDTPIEFLKGVGPQRGELLRKELSIFTFGDLLMHYPHRYLDSTKVQSISSLHNNLEYVQLKGVIVNVREEGNFGRKRVAATLIDKTGQLDLVWFQGGSYIAKNIQSGSVYFVFGKLNIFNGRVNIVHPEIEPQDNSNEQVQTAMQPMYPSTEKLRNKGLNNRTFARLTKVLIEKLTEKDIPDSLPQYLLQNNHLCSSYFALTQIHFPKNEQAYQAAIRRLKWEELFITQLKIGKLKVHNQLQQGYVFDKVGDYFNEFYSKYLPFELTNAQKRVIKEIRENVRYGKQMNRLLQGDVGSGKTMVALLTMLLALDNGFQACLMAPTEILAKQHYDSISTLCKPMSIPVALLTGSVKAKAKKQILESLNSGICPIIVGTHALIEDTVKFKNLGIAVIDEQHRFGVQQRAKLWQKNILPPHVLVMTATPIPRTLAMTAYGDLDVSVIDELPPGRKPITTVHRTENFRPKVMQFAKSEIDKGRQIYFVYPLIEESDKLDFESLMAGYEQVKAWFLPEKYNIAMVYGKQPPDEKENNMQRFVNGLAQILVATTVIEVGVNVPNASVMIIESAERFGLSQLHQLRGRVGRGSDQSYCVLLTGKELSKEGRQRMSIMTQTNDGFVIAEEDMKMRGPGDIYGTRQSGALNFKVADIVHDTGLLEETRNAAQILLQKDPNLSLSEHRVIKNVIEDKSDTNPVPWSRIS